MYRKDSSKKMFKKAERCLKNNDFAEAKNNYLKCLAIEPDNLNALNNLAQLYGMLGDDENARGYNEILLRKCNEQLECNQNETLLILKANALISLERNAELSETLDELLKQNQDEMSGKHEDLFRLLNKIRWVNGVHGYEK